MKKQLTLDEAMYVLNDYQNKGYPSASDYCNDCKLTKEKMRQYDTLYLLAVLTFCESKGYTKEAWEKEKHERVRSVVGTRMDEIRGELAFRETDAGKKLELRKTYAMVPLRTEQDDEALAKKNRELRRSLDSIAEKCGKRQARLNTERMEHIEALEKSIAKGSKLRNEYDKLMKEQKDSIDNMRTSEECGKIIEEKRHKAFLPALILSWVSMPLYVLIKSFGILFDGLIPAQVLGGRGDILSDESQLGGHPITGRWPLLITGAVFVGAVNTAQKLRLNPNLITELMSEKQLSYYAAMNNVFWDFFVPKFLLGLIGISVARSVIGFASAFVAEFGCGLLQGASNIYFVPGVENLQQGRTDVATWYCLEKEKEIQARVDLIKDLTAAIQSKLPKGEIDKQRARGKLSLKRLERENRN